MKTLTTLLTLALASCQPAHADEVIWINDNSGQVVAQATVTGNTVWLLDASGQPTGNATLSPSGLRAPATAFFSPDSPFREPRGLRLPRPRQDVWDFDDNLGNGY